MIGIAMTRRQWNEVLVGFLVGVILGTVLGLTKPSWRDFAFGLNANASSKVERDFFGYPLAYAYFSRQTGKITRISVSGQKNFVIDEGYSGQDVKRDYESPEQEALMDMSPGTTRASTHTVDVKLTIAGKLYTVPAGFDLGIGFRDQKFDAKYYNRYIAKPTNIPNDDLSFAIADPVNAYANAQLNKALARKGALPDFQVSVSKPFPSKAKSTSSTAIAVDWKKGMSALATYRSVYGDWPTVEPHYVFNCEDVGLTVTNDSEMAKAAVKYVPESRAADFSTQLETPGGIGIYQSIALRSEKPCGVR